MLNSVLTESGAVAAEARNLTDGREEENKQLRARVTSIQEQLEEAEGQVHVYSQQAEEMRAHSSTAGRAGQQLKQQVRLVLSLHLITAEANYERTIVRSGAYFIPTSARMLSIQGYVVSTLVWIRNCLDMLSSVHRAFTCQSAGSTLRHFLVAGLIVRMLLFSCRLVPYTAQACP